MSEELAVQAIPGELTKTSLTLREGLSLEEWAGVLMTLKQMSKSIQWWVGDALAYGEDRFGESAFAYLDQTDKTLANWAYTCRALPNSRRRESLSYSVHAEVAPLNPELQETILEEAEREGYTVGQTRERVRKEQQEMAEEEHGPSEVVVKKTCPTCNGEGEVIVE